MTSKVLLLNKPNHTQQRHSRSCCEAIFHLTRVQILLFAEVKLYQYDYIGDPGPKYAGHGGPLNAEVVAASKTSLYL